MSEPGTISKIGAYGHVIAASVLGILAFFGIFFVIGRINQGLTQFGISGAIPDFSGNILVSGIFGIFVFILTLFVGGIRSKAPTTTVGGTH